MYKILANARKTKPSCSHNSISNTGNTESDVRTLQTYMCANLPGETKVLTNKLSFGRK